MFAARRAACHCRSLGKGYKICTKPLRNQCLYSPFLSLCVILSTPLRMRIRYAIAVKHSHQAALSGGCLVISRRNNIEEGVIFQYVEDLVIPLASDKQ